MKPGAAELWGWGFGLGTEGVKNQIICSSNQPRSRDGHCEFFL